jgi:ketosteroid isomerase-like protein
MRNPRLIPAALIALVCAACGSRSNEPQFGTAETTLIRQRTTEFASVFNAKDIDKIIGFYGENIVFMPPNSPALRGHDAVKNFFRDLYAQGATELKLEATDVVGHGPLAYEAGTYSLNRRPPTGAHTRDRGKYMFVWRNFNNRWVIEYTIWSSDLPEKVDIAPVK